MNKKIVIGSIIAISMLLMMPTLSAIKLTTHEEPNNYPIPQFFIIGIIRNLEIHEDDYSFYAIRVFCFPPLYTSGYIECKDFKGIVMEHFICGKL